MHLALSNRQLKQRIIFLTQGEVQASGTGSAAQWYQNLSDSLGLSYLAQGNCYIYPSLTFSLKAMKNYAKSNILFFIKKANFLRALPAGLCLGLISQKRVI